MTMQTTPRKPFEAPVPEKKPEIKPYPDPDEPTIPPEEPVMPGENPDLIPEEDPFETPPYEVPPPGEGP